MTTLQLLIALEEHGVLDIYNCDGTITMITANGLNLPGWLVEEYRKHTDDLLRQLRRRRPVILCIGVFK